MNPRASALCLHDGDDVAVMLVTGKAADICEIKTASGTIVEIALRDDIEFGHKLAMRDIEAGREVLKFGEPIGLAIQPIQAGEHVHVHNLGSGRKGLRGSND